MGGGLTPLQRSSRCILQPQPTGQKVYLRMSHMFVPILTDMFNHWFAQGAIPGSVTKGVITLLKKGGKHVGEGLDDYRRITA